MSEPICILVLGLGPLASATARRLLLAGHPVALLALSEPKNLRRKMSYADAYRVGAATLDGVEARLTRSDAAFVAGLRQSSFIPLLSRTFAEAAARWPWDVIVDGMSEEGGSAGFDCDARLRIGLGAGPIAGEDCDLVIATEGPDPGAVIRAGAAPAGRSELGAGLRRGVAPVAGFFTPAREIGACVGKDEVLGRIAGEAVLAPRAGRLIGLAAEGARAARGELVAEVALRLSAPFSGVSSGDQALARAVHFAMDMELNGWTPPPPIAMR